MRRTPTGWAAACALVVTLTGCGSPPGTATPAPAPAGNLDDTVCAAHLGTAETVAGIAKAVEAGPVLPAGVALFLLDARTKAASTGISDPGLAAAQAELVAAIDDVDAQGKAAVPPGGNPAQNTVQLDIRRITAASAAVTVVCAAR